MCKFIKETFELPNNRKKQVFYYESGQVFVEQYYRDGKLHSESDEEPSYVKYYENGGIKCEEYCIKGKLHREGFEPCYILYNEQGIITTEKYFINGEEIFGEFLEKHVKRKKILNKLNKYG